MDKYTAWSFCYSKRHYLTHPWKWFKDLWRGIRDSWMRAKYGFCYSDVWDWDNWFLYTTPQMLRHMADKGSAYPGMPPFETSEKWHDWLHEVADLLESGREDWQDAHNEYHDEYMKQLSGIHWEDDNEYIHCMTREKTEIDKKYWDRAHELSKQGEDNVRRAMSMMGEHFFCLWD